jgi:hypothetical protein
MKIDYVVISSDDNPMYKDFYEIIAKRWNQFGIKVYYINITDRDEIIENNYGIIHKIKSVGIISTGLQSQIVRLFAANLIKGNLITSDIDMYPISKDYFMSRAAINTEDKIMAFSENVYSEGNVTYPICYILSEASLLRECLGINNMSFYDFCKMIKDRYKESWGSDEAFLYEELQKHQDKVTVLRDRDMSWHGTGRKRIDRYIWTYDLVLLWNGFYVDSHLLRPYSQYKNEIDFFLQNIRN